MKKINFAALGNMLFYILTPILLGTFVGLVFNDDNQYVESLNKTFTIPPIVFPIVWSVLYLLIGLWYYNYQKDGKKVNKTLYYILLAINLLFTPVLFYFNNITLALIMVIVLLIGNIYLFKESLKEGRKSSFLLVPYLMWLVFALILMIDLFVNNVIG